MSDGSGHALLWQHFWRHNLNCAGAVKGQTLSAPAAAPLAHCPCLATVLLMLQQSAAATSVIATGGGVRKRKRRRQRRKGGAAAALVRSIIRSLI